MSTTPPPEPLIHVPNLLSAARIPLAVALFACIVYEAWLPGLVVFLVATATDWLDGWWARRYGPLTLVGRNLDPIADKVETTLPAEHLRIEITIVDENRRRFTITGAGEQYEELVRRLG